VAELYASRLTESGSAPDGELIALRTEFDVLLNAAQDRAQAALAVEVEERKKHPVGVRPFRSPYEHQVDTAVPQELLDKVAPVLWQMPPDFSPNPKVKRLLDAKADAYKSGANIDWSLGEGLAFASLLAEGYPVRLSGQDCERGTFSHRHAVLHDPSNDAEYCPLGSIAGAEIELVNSSLSEYAILGFDYGYSLEAPDSLVIWEAQFGDFANGAQIMIDQFIASAESKWGQASGLVLLLPHGYEGQGPEHSSARLERFLQLCAENNLQVVQPSGAAFPRAASSGQVRASQTARGDDAEEPAAPQGLREHAGRPHRRPLPRDPARRHAFRPDGAPASLLRQGLLRARRRTRRPQGHLDEHRPHRTVLSLRRRGARQDPRLARIAQEGRLGPGRTEEHGRLVLRRRPGRINPWPAPDLCRP
jgi:2-oxoglutarate dehydrogenase complex dehydrogenase (E1) component-like enzyme